MVVPVEVTVTEPEALLVLVLGPEVVETVELEVVLTVDVEVEVGAVLEEDGVQLGRVKVPLELPDEPSTMQLRYVSTDSMHGA